METASINITINCDDGSEAVAKTASVNAFCPPRLSFFVIVGRVVLKQLQYIPFPFFRL